MIYDSIKRTHMKLEIFDKLADTDFVSQDAKGRYKIFKEYIGKFWFYECLFPYLRLALREDDIHSITAAIQELDDIRKHDLLTNPISRGRLYVQAKSYVVYMVETERRPEDCDDLTLILMMIVLHETNYFDTLSLPHEAFEPFEPDGISPYLQIVGEVYGKYFMFYDYLQGKLKECESTLGVTQSGKTDKPKSGDKVPVSTFRDTFLSIHKNKFDAMIKLLRDELPMEITRDYEELRLLDGPMVYGLDDDLRLNSLLPSKPSYMGGLFRVCLENEWLLPYPSIKEFKNAIGETFSIVLNSPTAFKLAKKEDRRSLKYIEPFRLLFQSIK